MTEFPNMAEIVPVGAKGVASVFHQSLDGAAAARASYVGGRYIATPPGTYAFLYVKEQAGSNTCMMSDLSYERDTCRDAARHAHGHVLIAGLGLGMILHPILRNPRVKSVTVIEKYQDVADLIRPTLPASNQLSIVVADIFAWLPPARATYDAIWFDIWPDILAERLREMALLHERFAACLNRTNPDCWMNSWHQHETQALAAPKIRSPFSNHSHSKRHTKTGEVTVKVPKLRNLPFETAFIERYCRRESSVEAALVEMHLAGVSVRRVEDIAEALWGTRVSPSTVSRAPQGPMAQQMREKIWTLAVIRRFPRPRLPGSKFPD